MTFHGVTDTTVFFLFGFFFDFFLTSGDVFSEFQEYMFPEIHLWCDTCQPLDGQHSHFEKLCFFC